MSAPRKPATCFWMEDSEGTWSSDCDSYFQFTDGGPVENGFKFCPYCGGKMVATPYAGFEDEGDE